MPSKPEPDNFARDLVAIYLGQNISEYIADGEYNNSGGENKRPRTDNFHRNNVRSYQTGYKYCRHSDKTKRIPHM